MKTWIWILLAAAAVQLLWPEPEPLAPYRFRIDAKPEADDVDALESRVARSPEGLDLAALAQASLKRARRTGQSRWIDQAEAAARRSLETLPVSNPGALLALAQAAQMKHDFAESIALCDQVLRDRPRDARALALKATAQLGLGDVPGALRSADALVDRSPVSEHLALRAVVLAAGGREREAIHDFRKAAALEEPGDAEGSAWLRAMWARLALQRGRTDDAESLLREALRIHPWSSPALGLQGELQLDRGRLDDADRAFRDAFQISGDPAFLVRRAEVRRRKGESPSELLDAAEKALRASPGHRAQLARLLLDRNSPEALPLIEAEAKLRRNVETLDTLARALVAAGRLSEARVAVREAIRTGALDARLHELAADIESRLGCPSRARMHLDAAREIRP